MFTIEDEPPFTTGIIWSACNFISGSARPHRRHLWLYSSLRYSHSVHVNDPPLALILKYRSLPPRFLPHTSNSARCFYSSNICCCSSYMALRCAMRLGERKCSFRSGVRCTGNSIRLTASTAISWYSFSNRP